MKCPHCHKEHPDEFQYCPVTGKKIEQLKACTNKDCPDCGKYTLPLDSRFCPTCGCEIEKTNTPSGTNNPIKVDLVLFDAGPHGIKVMEIIKKLFDLSLGEGWRIVNNTPSIISLNVNLDEAEQCRKALEEWSASVGIAAAGTAEEAIRAIINDDDDDDNSDEDYDDDNSDEDYDEDNNYGDDDQEKWEGESCPQCGSDDVTDDGSGYLECTCKKCGYKWGGRYDIKCPKCGSFNIVDDGSNHMQYSCYDCDHVWGNSKDRNAPLCPECGSENIEDDGSWFLQYTCEDCGHEWGNRDDIKCPKCGAREVIDTAIESWNYRCLRCNHIWDDDEQE